MRGEVRPTLDLLRARGTPLVLGLRDVMDDPTALESEWERKNAVPALQDYYDEIWVYGLPQICDPLAGLDLPASVRRRMVYTGYLRRTASAAAGAPRLGDLPDGKFLLVTAGGGGDGDGLIDWVLAAYEDDPGALPPAMLVFGPFMLPDRQAAFAARAALLPNVHTLVFDARLEGLIARAGGIVAMGGYNTFCEILSFDKPALIVPRTTPRLEQYIRARRAAELGLVAMLPDDESRDPKTMAAALRRLSQQPRPSTVVVPGLLDGMELVNRLALKWLASGRPDALVAARRGNRQQVPPRMIGPVRLPGIRGRRVAFVLKGYPRLSETFIAQEIEALERRGLGIAIVSLRHPTDRAHHPLHASDSGAGALPARVFERRATPRPRRPAGSPRGCRVIGRRVGRGLPILLRDPTPNRIRRWGQALVLAAELPPDTGHLHAHFLHTPASVARYAAIMRGLPWSRFGACQGHLDHSGVGETPQACLGGMGGDLHQ